MSGSTSESEASSEKMPQIVCFPRYPPVELIHSFGFNPIIPWMLEEPPKTLTDSDQHLETFTCGIARVLTQFLLEERVETSNVVAIMGYNACDSLRNMPELIQEGRKSKGLKDVPFIKFHIPATNLMGEFADQYMIIEIKNLITELETLSNKPFSSKSFLQSVRLYKTLRTKIREIEGKIKLGIVSFTDLTKLLKSINFLPIQIKIKELKYFIDNLPKQTSFLQSKNILLSGIIPPPEAILKMFDEFGFNIVTNDIASIDRLNFSTIADSSDPKRYYTNFYKFHHPCTTLHYTSNKRMDFLLDKVSKNQIDGIIFIGEKYCEYEYFELPYLKRICNKNDLPLLDLEFSVESAKSFAPYRIRIQAFAELLNNKNNGEIER